MERNQLLSEMTLQQLWELFPIILSEHKNCWADWYQEEKQYIKACLHGIDLRINHIGSTAIGGIWAKPIIDILVEVSKNCCMETIKSTLVDHGYICMSQSKGRVSFNKGYTNNGFAERVFHLHLRNAGDNDELYFRDYLVEHKEIALAYEKLKLELWKKFEHDRDGYTNAKTEFVWKHTQEAKKFYGSRYGFF